ncbi:MAG: polysaccharide pyruvyl transferase family protein [Hyphomonadaceae bacterium]
MEPDQTREPGSKRPLRVGVLGQFGIGNLGNDGSLQAMLDHIRRVDPEADITCICSDPDLISRRHGVAAQPIRVGGGRPLLGKLLLGAPKFLKTLRHAQSVTRGLDLVVVPGTGVLDDFNEKPSGLPFDMWVWSRSAKANGARMAFVSVGAGPITHGRSRRYVKEAAAAADYRSYRDIPSFEFMKSIGALEADDQIYPDIAFSLPAPPVVLSRVDERIVVALGVMAYRGWSGRGEDGAGVYRDYVARMADYVGWLVETGRRVRFLIGKDSDLRTAEDIRKAALIASPGAAEYVAPVAAMESLQDVMSELAHADIAVVTRFHNLVCALKMHVPTVSIGYADKNRSLLEEMGLGAFSQEIESLDLDTLKSHTDQIIETRAAHRSRIAERVAEYRTKLNDQWARLAPLFGRTSS